MEMKTRGQWLLRSRYSFDHWLEIRFGGSDLATARMEEINPKVDTGCLPYLAAINKEPAIRPVPEEQPGKSCCILAVASPGFVGSNPTGPVGGTAPPFK